MDLSHLKNIPAKLVGVFGIVATLGACATPEHDAERQSSDRANNTSFCTFGGNFKILAGAFAASISGYNQKCGAVEAVKAILYTSQSADERAFAIAALAEEFPHIQRQLDAFADAVISGSDPLIHALPAGTAIECEIGDQISSGNGQTTYTLDKCGGPA